MHEVEVSGEDLKKIMALTLARIAVLFVVNWHINLDSVISLYIPVNSATLSRCNRPIGRVFDRSLAYRTANEPLPLAAPLPRTSRFVPGGHDIPSATTMTHHMAYKQNIYCPVSSVSHATKSDPEYPLPKEKEKNPRICSPKLLQAS